MSRLQAIVLAGGAGRRFGGGKLLAPYRGGELIDGALQTAFAAPVEGVIVVTGYDGERVGESVAAFADKHGAGLPLLIVHAADYAKGMSSTLHAGVAALPAETDAAFVFLGDMPSIPAEIPGRLRDALGGHAAAAPVHDGQRGHPVLFSRRLFSPLLSLTGDQGARVMLDDLGKELALVEIDNRGVLFDVDRWSDLLA